MNFTFAICASLIKIRDNKMNTDDECIERIHKIIDDIERLGIPNYEILIAGLDDIDRKNTKAVKCPDSNKNIISLNDLGFEGEFYELGGWHPGHITKKKNVMCKIAKYENIVLTHDYYTYSEDWYEGYLRYGDQFKVCCNRVINPKGERYMDWMIWPFNGTETDKIVSNGIESGHNGRECLLPYDIRHLSRYMYVQGSYWVAKKDVMLKFPLNENKLWGMGEDVEWSMIYRSFPNNNFSINAKSTCILLKDKESAFVECSEKTAERLRKIH